MSALKSASRVQEREGEVATEESSPNEGSLIYPEGKSIIFSPDMAYLIFDCLQLLKVTLLKAHLVLP